MRLLLDTNCYSAMGRGDDSLRDLLEQAERVFVPFIAIGELRAGFAGGALRERNERELIKFLALPNVSVLFPDMTTTRVYGDLVAALHFKATPIPTNDIWIAALALQHDLTVCTRDTHFKHVPGLSRI